MSEKTIEQEVFNVLVKAKDEVTIGIVEMIGRQLAIQMLKDIDNGEETAFSELISQLDDKFYEVYEGE